MRNYVSFLSVCLLIAIAAIASSCTKQCGPGTYQNSQGQCVAIQNNNYPGAPPVNSANGQVDEAFTYGTQASKYRSYPNGEVAYALPMCTYVGNRIGMILGEIDAIALNFDLSYYVTHRLSISWNGQLPDGEPCTMILSYTYMPHVQGTPCNPKMLNGSNPLDSNAIAQARNAMKLDANKVAELNQLPEKQRYNTPYTVVFSEITKADWKAISTFENARIAYNKAAEISK